MKFTDRQKLTALSICHIFETSTALGDATTVAVLKDGAGISYGIPQATHKSGNLADVLQRYIAGADEPLYEPLFRKWMPTLLKTDQRTVNSTARNAELKRALKEAGEEPEMRRAQLANIDARMDQAVRACAGSGWTSTLALAVVYDSINHGSWGRIRDSIKSAPERQWITAYLRARRAWLKGHSNSLLRKTIYRPDFFLTEIAEGNWDLKLPVTVHGFRLMNSHIQQAEQELEDLKSGVNVAAHEETTLDPATDGVEQPGEPDSSVDGSPFIQEAETIINTGDMTNALPPKDETIVAPAKDGATSTATKNTILGFAVPPTIWAIYQSITDLIEKGSIDMREIATGGFQLLRENYKYVLMLVGLIVCLLIVKKFVKQVTFWIQMISRMVPHFNNIEVVPGPTEPPSKWWEIWK